MSCACRSLGLTVVAASVLVTGCSAGSSGGIPQGTSIDGYGTQVEGTVGYDKPEIGRLLYFGFPELANASTSTVRLLAFHVDHVNKNVRVTGFKVYSLHDQPDAIAVDVPGPGDQEHLDTVENYLTDDPTAIEIAPRSASKFQVLVGVRELRRTTAGQILSGCEVIYSAKTKIYRQTLTCRFSVGG